MAEPDEVDIIAYVQAQARQLRRGSCIVLSGWDEPWRPSKTLREMAKQLLEAMSDEDYQAFIAYVRALPAYLQIGLEPVLDIPATDPAKRNNLLIEPVLQIILETDRLKAEAESILSQCEAHNVELLARLTPALA